MLPINMDLIFWSSGVMRIGCVFSEVKVQAHLVSTLYLGLAETPWHILILNKYFLNMK